MNWFFPTPEQRRARVELKLERAQARYAELMRITSQLTHTTGPLIDAQLAARNKIISLEAKLRRIS